MSKVPTTNTACTKSLDQFHIVGYYINWGKTSWAFSIKFSTIYY